MDIITTRLQTFKSARSFNSCTLRRSLMCTVNSFAIMRISDRDVNFIWKREEGKNNWEWAPAPFKLSRKEVKYNGLDQTRNASCPLAVKCILRAKLHCPPYWLLADQLDNQSHWNSLHISNGVGDPFALWGSNLIKITFRSLIRQGEGICKNRCIRWRKKDEPPFYLKNIYSSHCSCEYNSGTRGTSLPFLGLLYNRPPPFLLSLCYITRHIVPPVTGQ
jgi:hypothetical protein